MTNREWTMAGIFADEGITGTSARKRPEFLKMIRLCKQKTAYEMRESDWSSDVCSSDLVAGVGRLRGPDFSTRGPSWTNLRCIGYAAKCTAE